MESRMRKNNKQVAQRGLKRDAKNKARKKRAEAKYAFNDMVSKVKTMQQSLEQAGLLKERK